MRPRPRPRPITVRPRPRQKKWSRDDAGLETLISLAFRYVWSLLTTWQRWRSLHPLSPPYPKTPCCTQSWWLYILLKRSFSRWKFYIAGMGIFDPFAPVTLTLTRWPSYANLTRIPSRYTGCAKKRTSYIKAFESYRLTDTTEIIYRVVKM